MDWVAHFNLVTTGNVEERVQPELAFLETPPVAEWSDGVKEQFRVLREAAVAMVQSEAAGDVTAEFVVRMEGRSNPGTAPAEGSIPQDYFALHVGQVPLSPPDPEGVPESVRRGPLVQEP